MLNFKTRNYRQKYFEILPVAWLKVQKSLVDFV